MKFLEHTHVVDVAAVAIVPAAEDQFASDIKYDVINMENAKSAVFLIKCLAGTGTASVKLWCVDAITAASSSTQLSFSYKTITGPDTQGATTEAKELVVSGSDKIYALEVDAAKLSEVGYSYVVMTAEEKSAFPVDGAVVAFLMGMRSAEDVTPTQVV